MRFGLKLLILVLVFVSGSASFAQQTRIIVAPVNIQTVNSTAGFYPNISNFIANDIINNLNKNMLFDAPDLNTSEELIMTHGLWSNYRDFLKSYKDRGNLDYKTCYLINKKLGVQKLLLISSGFSMQSMVLERPFWYRIGFTGIEPVKSFYRLDVNIKLVDTQNGIVEFDETFKQNFKVNNFEVPSNSMSDNIVSKEKIKRFSEQISEQAAQQVFVKTAHSAYTNIKSSIIPNENFQPRDGKIMTRDGLFSSPANENSIMNKRKDSFKNWVKERLTF